MHTATRNSTTAIKRIPFIEILWWVAVLLIGAGTYTKAQTGAEYAGAVSEMSTVGISGTPMGESLSKTLEPVEEKATAAEEKVAPAGHITQSSSASGEDANRRELEGKAGEDASKLLLRSEPTGASVWIEGKRIGSTPLLLMLAPGAYQVEMRGGRMERAARQVDLQSRETRQIVIPLEQRYPSHVKLR